MATDAFGQILGLLGNMNGRFDNIDKRLSDLESEMKRRHRAKKDHLGPFKEALLDVNECAYETIEQSENTVRLALICAGHETAPILQFPYPAFMELYRKYMEAVDGEKVLVEGWKHRGQFAEQTMGVWNEKQPAKKKTA